MKRFFTIFTLLALIFIQSVSNAQETKSCTGINFDLGGDLYSRYVWRGTQFGGNAPSIQPYASMAVGNLELGFWGAYSLSGWNTGQELDLYLSYSFLDEMFSVAFTDYFFPDVLADYNYFDYAAPTTGHIFEGSLSFNGTEKIPFTFLAAINFFGADAAKIESDPTSPNFNTKTGLLYSSYFEAGYSKTIKSVDFSAFVGFTLTSPQEVDSNTGYIGETGFYGSKAGVVNTGISLSKEIEITEKYSLPISASVIANPDTKKMFFILGISF
ncbi:MAG: hypothetical protein JXL97_07790 [Bacteroidales bacterium]|nr:hypothetical protein [Bacteroidales bacterium]